MTVVLFHSAQGLRPGIHWFADRLREAGHEVHTPDLFDGEVFDELDDGVRKRDNIGIGALIGRSFEAVAELPEDVVYAGFSMGTGPAMVLAAGRPGCRGAVFFHGALDPADAGIPAWPSVPAQVHYSTKDAWVDSAAVEGLRRAVLAAGQTCEVFAGDVEGHLVADPDLPEYDEVETKHILERTLNFLDNIELGTQ